eukprot:TRINITY_DN12207_c0_g1_i2.p2 TRINITY_DN12207_c0_g1~~TRINITY_DN12207_c0_g1_i2.p2  ORF type:complete len:456 (+),score=180.06 TRINITY_DN12207_c0_g1_i2:86-1369(+)
MPSEGFDLEAFAARYPGGGLKIQRLLHVARNAPSPALCEAAWRAAVEEVKQTLAVKQYVELVEDRADVDVDHDWVDDAKKRAASELSVLENSFGVANASRTGDEKRVALRELGRHYRRRGDTATAAKYFFRMRDCTTKGADVLEMCLEVIAVGIEARSWSMVNQHCARAEQNRLHPLERDKVAFGQVCIARALFLVGSGKYKAAALRLLTIPPELGDAAADVLPATHIATYAALLALASFSRAELKAKFIDTTPFRAYLEQAPELLEVVHDFYHSRYACLKVLDLMTGKLHLDLFLSAHATALHNTIRERALQQYTTPYLAVDMNVMAAAFQMPLDELEEALAQIILKGGIPARIDSDRKVLHRRGDNVVRATFEDVLGAGRQLIVDTEDHLRRISMSHARFEYKGDRDADDNDAQWSGGANWMQWK